MSRRKQSNPKPLSKSDMDCPSSEMSEPEAPCLARYLWAYCVTQGSLGTAVGTGNACTKDSKNLVSGSSEVKSGDEWESDQEEKKNSTTDLSIPSETDQSAPVESLTSPNPQQVSEEDSVDQNLNPSNNKSLDLSSRPVKERSSPLMATSERKGSIPSVSFADLPKLIASNSYLAAALKSSVALSSFSTAGVFSLSDASHKQGITFSPPDSPSTTSSKGTSNLQASTLNSLSEAAINSCLLKASLESNSNHLSNMIKKGIPLLSSVLPALQRLVPISSIGSASSGTGGILCVCGVKFNSTSNLEAHRMFYCSHRQVNTDGRSERKEESRSPSRDSEEGGTSPTGRLLKCPHCAYTTSHKLSLNGHMNIHTNPEDSSPQSSNKTTAFSSSVDPRAQERYCADCDIQFSSMKTFRVHKAHYCQTRHVLKGAKSPAREDSLHISIAGLSNSGGQPVLALPTNPVLLLPYSLVAGAQLLPAHILPHLGAAFVLPNGQVHHIPSATSQHSGNSNSSIPPLLSPGAIAAATAAIISASNSAASSTTIKGDHSFRSKSPREEETTGKRRGEGDSPLDLTTKRAKLTVKTDLLNDEEKENREMNNSSGETKSPVFKCNFGGGEFEGKLLSSPPRISPSTEGEETSASRSPRPASAAPSLCSPRAPPESPRPSTSAMSTNSRSPGHSSPVTSAASTMPTLPHGFPNSLVNSLESLGSTIPLASLQCLQSLQNVPRDLALKLISPELLMNGLPPVLNPPVIVKQGEAKCNECNIVFYKEESLQVHKKHYCSARDVNKSNEEERTISSNRSPSNTTENVATPLRSPVREVPSSTNNTTVKDSPKPSKPLLQFICTACGIKYSSPDNLAAHQTYYCPKREGASEEGIAKGVWRCPRCRVVMAETMQAAHQCVSPTPAPSHGWKCPCCPVLSPTAAAAQKHLETHAGIKAFRCTICGYRGNTLRGMRTHIRMHFEKRTSDLQEENFIACILEDDEQRGRNSASTSSETRKLIDSTRLLLENSALSALLGEASLSEQVESPLACAYCPFITSARTTLLQHLTLVHKIGLENKLAQEIKNLLEANTSMELSLSKKDKHYTENGTRESSPPVSSIKLEPEIKLEIQDPDEDLPQTTEETDSRPPSASASTSSVPNGSPLSNGQCYCQACNISFSLLDSYVAHKRFYCTRPESSTPPETTVQ